MSFEPAPVKAKRRRSPLIQMARFFFVNLFESEVSGHHGQARVNIATALALLATPGLLLPLFLLDRYSTLLNLFFRGYSSMNRDLLSIPDKYLFITYAMLVTGIITVLRWSSLLPDRADASNLGPLPVTLRTIFLSKFLALVAFMVLLAVDANTAGAILFPSIAWNTGQWEDLLRFMLAHFVAVAASSVFAFLFVTALIGLLMNTLPASGMRRASVVIQAALVVALLACLLMSPGIYSLAARGQELNGNLVFLPPVWFLGLYQTVQGQADGAYIALARFAMMATGFALLAAGASYVLWLPGFLSRANDGSRQGRFRLRGVAPGMLKLVLRTNFERAFIPFMLRTLWRDQIHRVIFAASAAIGCAVALERLTPFLMARANSSPAAGLERLFTLPLVAIIPVVYGLRRSFDIPAALAANWVFRSISGFSVHACRSAARKVMLLLGVLPILAVSAAAGLLVAPAWWILLHMVYTGGLSLLLTELLLQGYSRLPFTSAPGTGGLNAAGLAALSIAGWLIITEVCAGIERALAPWPFAWAGAGIFAAAVAYYVRWRNDAEEDVEPNYDASGSTVTTLDLSPTRSQT